MRSSLVAAACLLACSHVPAPGNPDASATTTTGDPAATDEDSPPPARDDVGDPQGTSTGDPAEVPMGTVVLRGGIVVGLGAADVAITQGRITAIGRGVSGDEEVDVRGKFLAPAFIDSHVHLAYAFDAPTLAKGGVAAAVDLAAPLDFLATSPAPLQIVSAGPMITAMYGYPTQTWGAGGFGLEVAGVDEVRDAVDLVLDAGARVIKVPLGHEPALSRRELQVLVERAHARGAKVVVHALEDASARLAADIGADVLAHTPTEALSDATIEAWSSHAVISTLDAFGGSTTTLENFAKLRDAGATIIYGTDLGNTGVPAIDHNELELLGRAGLDGAAILAAGTATPAGFWAFDGLGELAVGRRASLLVLAADPRREPMTLTEPDAVYIDGALQPAIITGGSGLGG